MMDDEGRLMFCMRSLLHYFGKKGLRPALRHLRSQMKPGEFFVHQTACFEETRSQGFFNQLYRDLGTGKWYPTVEELKQALGSEGWRVRATSPAPSLALTRSELRRGTGWGRPRCPVFRTSWLPGAAPYPGPSSLHPEGFTAYLHYSILTCQAC